MKALKIKLFLKISAIFDIIFANKFTLTTFYEDGNINHKTTYCKKEVDLLSKPFKWFNIAHQYNKDETI